MSEKEFEFKMNTHTVLKNEDIKHSLTGTEQTILQTLIMKIMDYRKQTGRVLRPMYYVVNVDEPYSDKILEVIKENQL